MLLDVFLEAVREPEKVGELEFGNCVAQDGEAGHEVHVLHQGGMVLVMYVGGVSQDEDAVSV